jgi:acyl-coenzyme A thioesterase PaaI-like protein
MKLRKFSFIWNFWPPFLGLGISLKNISDDFKKITVVLKKRPWNVNYFGSQYGGGIFAMTDGIHMLMLVRNLPKNYRVWDKAANIRYLRRGLTNLTAEIAITNEDLTYIQNEVQKKSTIDWDAEIDIKDDTGQIVAHVVRTLSIKYKQHDTS